MNSRRKAALVRFVRIVAIGAASAGVTTALGALPVLGDAVPSPLVVLPVLTALLAAADKWLRGRKV